MSNRLITSTALPGRKSSLKSLVAFAGALGKLGKQLAGLRWLHPAGGAHEQRDAKLLLQRADLVAQRGLGEEQLPCGGRKVQCFVQRQKAAQLAVGHGRSLPSGKSDRPIVTAGREKVKMTDRKTE